MCVRLRGGGCCPSKQDGLLEEATLVHEPDPRIAAWVATRQAATRPPSPEASDPDYETLYSAIDHSDPARYAFTLKCKGFDDMVEFATLSSRPALSELESAVLAELERRQQGSALPDSSPLKLEKLSLQTQARFNDGIFNEFQLVDLLDASQLDSLLARGFKLSWPKSGYIAQNGLEIAIDISVRSTAVTTAGAMLRAIDDARAKVRAGEDRWAQTHTTLADGKPTAAYDPIVLVATLAIGDESEVARLADVAETKALLGNLSRQMRKEMPSQLLESGLVLAVTGQGGCGSGGGMVWESHYAMFDPQSEMVTIVSEDGSDHGGVSVRVGRPMAPAEVPRKISSLKWNSITAAGERILWSS